MALLWIAWRFIEIEGPAPLSSVLMTGSLLPRWALGAYALGFGTAAVTVGRYRFPAFALLLPHVAALVHVCAVAVAARPTGHVESRVVLSFGIALDVGRLAIVAGLLCAGLTWWSCRRKLVNARPAEPR
ncbi:MAG: hypothetical protein H6718_03760 [Polyangiaceae bacterium]|nr:hypothetical protein [Myxococcales bacterium]MCB9584483.1 hypothetical protein [Polyangiaceae bacterium]MCB9609326.1 hypothetical protein [Polyangiaceae bacterium]